jgi:hypothetical protein
MKSTDDKAFWIACHHVIARPQIADGGDGLQMWNKELRTTYKSANVNFKNNFVTKCYTVHQTWTDSLGKNNCSNNNNKILKFLPG